SFTPATAGTFYAEVVNDATTCISANRVAVTLNENPLPADATNPVGNSYCAGEALTTISVDDPGAGFTVNWYDASSNGNLVGTGFNFTPAAPGAFYAEIENDLTGCTSANRVAVTLTENPLPADATNPADNSYCAGEALTAISVDNPGAGFTVNWYDAATNGNLMGTGFSFIPATAGTFYAEVVNDATTCISANRVAATLTESPLPADATNPVGNSYCAGEALTAISVDNPGAGFTVNWYDASSNGNLVGIGFSFTPAAAGTYYAEVENDLTGCVSVNRVAATLTENPLPANAANPVNGLYCTGDPIPGISVDDPGAGFEVNWFTVATGGTVVFTGPVYNPGADGSYYAEIRNTVTGCISAGRVAVVISEVGIASADITENLRCASAFNGAISLSMVGDSNDYTFDWTGPDAFSSSDQNISGLAAGTYDVIVTYVPTGCTISESYVVTENLPVLGITETITNNTRCIATFNGAIEVDITGATGALSFSWTGPGGFASTNQNISQLAAGTYSLTVTDVNSGCTLTDDFEVIEDAEQPQLTEAITDNTNCTAPFNGAIDISVSPAGTYTYAWTGPNGFTSNSQDISNLAPGDYEVTVSNTTTACVVTEIYTVQDNSSVIDVTLNNTTGNDACNFPFNGAVSINVSPAGFYTYAWAGPNGFTSVNQNISGVQHGDYTVTVSNTSGCVQVETFTVADDRDAPLIQSSTVTDNNNCQAPFNGAISITATGGSGNYTFAWVGPNAYSANTSNITDLAAGTYIVTITDDSGCANAFDFTVNNDTPPINITLNNSTANDNCQAPYTGSLTISVSGTAGPYSFEWTGPDGFTSTQQNIANLVHGDYTITVTDDTEGCVAVATFNVVDNTPVLSISIDNNTENTSCSEPFNGAIDISLTGGSGNYLFDWTGPDGFTASTASIAGLAAGAYTITVTDQDLGCIVTEEIIVDNNTTPILADETIVPNTACESPFDGSISLSNITGTPGPFSFDWAGPNGFSADTQNISALASGTYSLTITDDVLGCSSILEFIVPDNTPALVLTETITDNTNCVIPFSGAIEIINISGGSGDYSFNWTGPDGFTANAQDIDELASGTYQLIVTDDVSGCSATYSYIVADNIAGISISPVAVNANTSCTSPFNGSIEIDITGSAGPFTFAWTGPAGFTANTQNINSLQPGNYNVIVTDDVQGCTASITLNVANDATGCEGLDCEAFTVSITDTRPTCVNQDDGQIVFNVAGGSGTYIVTLFANNFTQAIPGTGPTFTFNNLSPANYQYTIQDGAGNTCTLPYTLLLESLLDAQITEFSDALCFNEPTGAATIQVFSGGTPPYQYSLDAVNWVNFVSPV
ncbi:MAG TPA: hypothetical protein PKC24_09800, partial [Cyclobacteriaceae bacterium]|nr:hypothetical protein [Cyclobacteriaceae bacterium]